MGPSGPIDLLDRRTHLLAENPVQVPHTDTKTFPQPGNSDIVHHAITNCLHNTTHQVLPVTPAHITGKTVGTASSARPEPRCHGGSSAREETTVFATGQPRGAGGTTVNSRRCHGEHEMPIPGMFATSARPVTGLLIEGKSVHVTQVCWISDQILWRNQDISAQILRPGHDAIRQGTSVLVWPQSRVHT